MVTFKWRPEGVKENFPGKRTSKCQDSEGGMRTVCLRNGKETNVE